MSELNQVSARFTDHHKVAHATAMVSRPFHESPTFEGARGKCGYFISLVTLKAEVIKRLANFALRNDDDELRFVARRGPRTEPDSTPTFETAVAHYC
ncbi:MAG: hypothetical protein ABJA83_12035 [Burkholderiaceae bacterium]